MGLVMMGSTGVRGGGSSSSSAPFSAVLLRAGAHLLWFYILTRWRSCSDTRHDMKDEDDNMLEGYDNVCTVQHVLQTSTELLSAINSLRNEEAECNCECVPTPHPR